LQRCQLQVAAFLRPVGNLPAARTLECPTFRLEFHFACRAETDNGHVLYYQLGAFSQRPASDNFESERQCIRIDPGQTTYAQSELVDALSPSGSRLLFRDL